MRHLPIAAALLIVALPAMAQTAPSPPEPPVLPARLPIPPIADDAAPSAFLRAAGNAIAAGRSGEAMEAIERAESRILIRSVRPSRAAVPSEQAAVAELRAARAALAAGERAAALTRIEAALRAPGLDERPE